MTERINTLLQWIVEGEHKALRMPLDAQTLEGIRAQIQREDLPLVKRAALRLRLLLENERVCVREDERIPGIRTIPEFPDIYAEGREGTHLRRAFIHEQAAFATFLRLRGGSARGSAAPPRAGGTDACRGRGDKDFLEAAIETIDAVIALCRPLRGGAAGRRRAEGRHAPRREGFPQCPAHAAHAASGALGLERLPQHRGRFDQYMWPYLKADLDKGMSHDEALELLEEFFLTFNRDSDLYTGMQQGDNGQSMVLGGAARGGGEGFNPLSEACLAASRELGVIDPKINLRVNRDTPLFHLSAGHAAHPARPGLSAIRKRRCGHPRPNWAGLCARGRAKLCGRRLLGIHHSRQGRGHSQHRRVAICLHCEPRAARNPAIRQRHGRNPRRCARGNLCRSAPHGQRHPRHLHDSRAVSLAVLRKLCGALARHLPGLRVQQISASTAQGLDELAVDSLAAVEQAVL